MQLLEDASPPLTRVVLVHAMNSTLDSHWYRSFIAQLRAAELTVVAPSMPEPFRPDAGRWHETLRATVGAVDETTAVVAHSVGNAAALQYLSSLAAGWTLGALVNVGGFAEPQPGNPATIPFTEGIDLARVQRCTLRRAAFIGSEDPEVPSALSRRLAAALDSEVRVVPGAGHFRDEDGYTEFPQLADLVTAIK